MWLKEALCGIPLCLRASKPEAGRQRGHDTTARPLYRKPSTLRTARIQMCGLCTLLGRARHLSLSCDIRDTLQTPAWRLRCRQKRSRMSMLVTVATATTFVLLLSSPLLGAVSEFDDQRATLHVCPS